MLYDRTAPKSVLLDLCCTLAGEGTVETCLPTIYEGKGSPNHIVGGAWGIFSHVTQKVVKRACVPTIIPLLQKKIFCLITP